LHLKFDFGPDCRAFQNPSNHFKIANRWAGLTSESGLITSEGDLPDQPAGRHGYDTAADHESFAVAPRPVAVTMSVSPGRRRLSRLALVR